MEFDDRRLLNFETYEDYLDSLISREDLYYLCSSTLARNIAELGYRSTNETLSRSQFYKRKEAAHEIVYPTKKPHILASADCKLTDPFLKELADRERSNRVGILSTIIFLRHTTKSRHEISGYIDFEESLRKSRFRVEGAIDWFDIFAEKKRLWPMSTDLGYFNWRTGYSVVNNSENFKVITDSNKGLMFMHRLDRKLICVDPLIDKPGNNTTRTVIFPEKYDHVVLYDHVVRKKS